MSKKTDKAAARAEYKAARKALERRRDKTETPGFIKANRRVLDAEAKVPWYRR